MSEHIFTPWLPPLAKDTLNGWLLTVQCEEATLRVPNFLADICFDYEPSLHRAVAMLQSSITTSLPAEVSAAVIIPQSSINLTRLIDHIRSRFNLATEANHMSMEA